MIRLAAVINTLGAIPYELTFNDVIFYPLEEGIRENHNYHILVTTLYLLSKLLDIKTSEKTAVSVENNWYTFCQYIGASYDSCIGSSGVNCARNRTDCLRSTSGVSVRSYINCCRIHRLATPCSPQTESPNYE